MNITLLSLMLFLGAIFSGSGAIADLQKFMISGSSTMAPLMSELVKNYEKNDSNVRFEVQTGGSAKGISDCRDQLNDIGMVSRAISADEKDLIQTTVATDGLAFIVNSSNQITGLSSDQIRQIYTGQITNWKQVGGADQKIAVVSKAEGRAALDFFLSYFKVKNSEIKAAVIIGDEEQGIKTVTSTPSAIAFLSVSSVGPSVKNKIPIRALKVDGVEGNLVSIRNGSYKLVRPLNLVTRPNMKNEKVKKFLAFVASKEGQALVEKLSYIPVR